MGKTIRLTMAQAVAHFLEEADDRSIDGKKVPIFGGVWAIFGHGNVAGIGEALYQVRDELPTYPRPQRAGHGACGHRLCQGELPPALHGVHHLDRPRRAQHGDGRRRRPCQPPAVSCSCPATSSPTARPIRCCSRSRISATARFRPTTPSARSRAISTASPGPSRSSRR